MRCSGPQRTRGENVEMIFSLSRHNWTESTTCVYERGGDICNADSLMVLHQPPLAKEKSVSDPVQRA